jgi:hypothetical protein
MADAAASTYRSGVARLPVGSQTFHGRYPAYLLNSETQRAAAISSLNEAEKDSRSLLPRSPVHGQEMGICNHDEKPTKNNPAVNRTPTAAKEQDL